VALGAAVEVVMALGAALEAGGVALGAALEVVVEHWERHWRGWLQWEQQWR